jgi:hypothetical protein
LKISKFDRSLTTEVGYATLLCVACILPVIWIGFIVSISLLQFHFERTDSAKKLLGLAKMASFAVPKMNDVLELVHKNKFWNDTDFLTVQECTKFDDHCELGSLKLTLKKEVSIPFLPTNFSYTVSSVVSQRKIQGYILLDLSLPSDLEFNKKVASLAEVSPVLSNLGINNFSSSSINKIISRCVSPQVDTIREIALTVFKGLTVIPKNLIGFSVTPGGTGVSHWSAYNFEHEESLIHLHSPFLLNSSD